ncbi:MAG: hypothetical protein LBU23_06665 [Planctomycetota bacterium]|jgi:type III secretion system needle length determinant|nr:hypothetical protein [Planctomycetota bacterium]
MADIGQMRGSSAELRRLEPEKAASRNELPSEAAAHFKEHLGGKTDAGDKPPGKDGLADLFGAAAGNLPGLISRFPAMPAGPVSVGLADGAADLHCGELVERILASQPAADGASEVRIKLDSSWLPETEVRLARSADGGLLVEFASDNVDAQRFLLPNLGGLRERLFERIGGQVTVAMSESGDAGAGAGDGRSRERRNLYEEIEER